VSALGEGGLLGLAVGPAFARNRVVYLYFTTFERMRLERQRPLARPARAAGVAHRRHRDRADPRLGRIASCPYRLPERVHR
jgi:hypothetical protein